MQRVNYKIIREKALKVFQKEGLDKIQSESTIDGLIWTSLRGIESHGINLLEHYVKEIRSGRINTKPSYKITNSSNNLFIMDADDSFGISAAEYACKFLTNKIEEKGVVCIFVINSSHCGALSNAVRNISDLGFVGLGMTHATAKMKTPNNNSAFVGNNPICLMVNGIENNFCFDSANSTTSFNEIRRNIAIDNKVPYGSGFDQKGNLTTVASDILFLNPIGDYKGLGLSMIVDLFCGVFTGMPSGINVSSMFGEKLSHKRKLGHFFMAFNTKKFYAENVALQVEKYIKSFHAHSNKKIFHPGQKEEINFKINIEKGILVSDKLREFLK